MKKFISTILVICALMVTLGGCVSNMTESRVVEGATSMFVEVENGPAWKVVCHKDTKVMYAVSFASYSYGNFTLLVNPDGSPMLWEE